MAHKRELKITAWKNGEDDGCSGTNIKHFIRNYLLDKYNNKCQLCGWGEVNPYTNKVPLEIHHKDGNYKNNKEDNLQVLCPNCHSLTDTYKGSNRDSKRDGRNKYINRKMLPKSHCADCGKIISDGSTRCVSCANSKKNHKAIPVSRSELKQMIRTMPFVKIGEMFSVTDNAIRKWCSRYGLPKRTNDIKQYSNEEWELI